MGKKVHLLDYVAGNIRSLVNAIEKCGYEVEWIRSPDDVKNAEVRDTVFSYSIDEALSILFYTFPNRLLCSCGLGLVGSSQK